MISKIYRLTALLASMLCAVPALHAAKEPPTPRVELQPHRFEGGDSQVLEAEKGWITVPENRRKPESRAIKLAFIRVKATGEKPGPPIVFLAGGPGASGIQGCRDWGFPIFQALREFGDVIAFDQRGTGDSQPSMECSDTPPRSLPLDRPVSKDEYLAAWTTQSRHCAETMRARGIDLAAYNTEENADDLNDLRRALGAEKISLWGTSYGTRLALAMIRRHGAHVHRAILAGVDGTNQTEELPHQQQEMLATIAALVKKDPQAGPMVPDLLGLMSTVLSRLEKEPVYVTVPDPRTGQTFRVGLSKLDLQVATADLLTGPAFFESLPDMYFRMAAGDFLPLALNVAPQRTGRVPASAMTFAMQCSSGATAARRKQIAEEAKTTLLADVINFPFPDLCAAWGVPDLGDAFRAPVVSDVPVLFISGTLDGRTPLKNAEEVLRGFKNGIHLVIENAGHGDALFLSSPKILQSIQTYMRGQTLPVTRIELPAPTFSKPRKIAKVAPEVLARYVGTYRVDDTTERRVFLVGDYLFSQRTGADPLLLRPQSDTSFFYEGAALEARFDVDTEGKVTRMVLVADGEEQSAPKIK